MRTIRTVAEMQRFADAERRSGRTIAFVPTMGALHEGHLSLVREAERRGDTVVVSIFVNPIQFNSRSDFEKYPRDDARDARLLEAAGVSALFLPEAEEIYPPRFQTRVEVTELTRPLCGAHRPGHFAGVTTVVAKLFLAVKPHRAVFGAKDYQQLQVVRQMVRDLNFDIEIVGAETVREADGLAMSSRNVRLSAEDRQRARAVPRGIERARQAAAAGESDPAALVGEFTAAVELVGARVEYAEIRDPETLEAVERLGERALLAVAVWIGEVRLIDNAIIERGNVILEPAAPESPAARLGR
jgi:pantoate--beta-alanine ligase